MKREWLFLSYIFFIGLVLAISSSSYNITNPTIGSGGNASSTNYNLGLIEEFSSGNASSTNYNTCLGFFCSPVDQSAPNVTLTSPDDGASYTSNSESITFRYNVTETNKVNNCSLIIGSAVNTTNSSVNKSEISQFTVTFGPASYTWNVNCTDNSNNIGNSSKRSFTVTAPSEASGGGISESGGPTPAKPSGGGGGGGVVSNLIIDKKNLDITSVINSVKTRKIGLYNNGRTNLDINIVIKGLEEIVIIKENEFILGPKEKKDIEIKIITPEKAGVYTGKIIVNGQEVLVKVDTSTKELLFDVNVVIPSEFKVLDIGETLKTQIILTPMGEARRLDVTLNYFIKDFDGNTFLSESETLLVETKKTLKKEFSTISLNPGNYVLALELIYPNGVAVSSSHFEVKEKLGPRIILVILGIGTFILILIIIIVLSSFKKIKIKRYK